MKRIVGGVVLCILAIAVVTVPVPFVEEGRINEPAIEFFTRNAVFHQEMIESYMDVTTFRKKYPMYNDLDDQELSMRLHAKYFTDRPLPEFRERFLRSGKTSDEARKTPYEGKFTDLFGIRGDVEEMRQLDRLTRAIFYGDAMDYELVDLRRRRIAAPYWVFPILGLAILALGVGLIKKGRRLRKKI